MFLGANRSCTGLLTNLQIVMYANSRAAHFKHSWGLTVIGF